MILNGIPQLILTLERRLRLDDLGLSKQLGVSPLSVWRWRKGLTRPRGKRLAKLMKLEEANRGA